MHTQELQAVAFSTKAVGEQGIACLLVHLLQQVSHGFGNGTAESLDGLIGDVRVKVQNIRFKMGWFICFQRDPNII